MLDDVHHGLMTQVLDQLVAARDELWQTVVTEVANTVAAVQGREVAVSWRVRCLAGSNYELARILLGNPDDKLTCLLGHRRS